MKNIEHGFTIANIGIIIFLILILWGIKWGSFVAPQIRSTANQVANLNNLGKVSVKCRIGGCVFYGPQVNCDGSI